MTAARSGFRIRKRDRAGGGKSSDSVDRSLGFFVHRELRSL